MKKYYTISFVILLVVLLALLVTSVALADKKIGFDGAWESIDVDGSYMVMVIANDSSYFMYYDFGASVCGKDSSGAPLYSASIEGSPVIDGYEMTVDGYVLCVADKPYYWPKNHPQIFTSVLTYDKYSDTIFDENVTWSRIEK